MLEKKDYKFKCGIKAYQQEATYKSDKLLIQVLKDLDLPDNIKELKLSDMIQLIVEKDVLEQVFDVILKATDIPKDAMKDGYPDWTMLTREEVIKVVEDFFTLSPSLKKILGLGSNVPAGL